MKLPLPKPPPKKPQKFKITKQNVEAINQKLSAASKAYRAAIALHDYADAYQQILPAYKLVPKHTTILMDLAYTELRMQRYEQAYSHYLKAIEYSSAPVDTNIYDGLAEVCHFLNKKTELA